MSVEAQLADEVVKVSIDGMVYTIKGTVDIVRYIAAMIDDKSKSENTAGKVKMKELIKEGGDIKLYEVPAGKLKDVVKEAKPFALKYAVCSKNPKKLEKDDKVIIAVPLSQAPLFERIVEKCRVFEVAQEENEVFEPDRENVENTLEHDKESMIGDIIENKIKTEPEEEKEAETTEKPEKQVPENNNQETKIPLDEKIDERKKEKISFAEEVRPELQRTETEETRSVSSSKKSLKRKNAKGSEKNLQDENKVKSMRIPEIDKEKLEEISRNMERGYYDKRFRPSVLKEQLVYASESAKEVNAAVKSKVKEELTK